MDPNTGSMIMGVVGAGVLLLSVVTIGGYMTYYRLKLARMKGYEQGGEDVRQAIQDLRSEVANLKDTTTRYDMSFDTALQRLENRMAHLEQRGEVGAQAEAKTQQGVGGR